MEKEKAQEKREKRVTERNGEVEIEIEKKCNEEREQEIVLMEIRYVTGVEGGRGRRERECACG